MRPRPFRSSFRQGLVSGEKYIVYPILEWCLLKLPDLKKRAYLARYLVKIDNPELDVMYKQAGRPGINTGSSLMLILVDLNNLHSPIGG